MYVGTPTSPTVRVKTQDYSTMEYVTVLSWEYQKVDYYTLSLNTSTENTVNTTMTSYILRAEYNVIIKVSNKAVNCAGTSEVASATVSVGMKLCFLLKIQHFSLFLLFSSAGCGPPSPPVNGSVGEWTSSRVGAQVTYSCDTHLVLVGETVAICSLPSLTWLPSSEDVSCLKGKLLSVA